MNVKKCQKIVGIEETSAELSECGSVQSCLSGATVSIYSKWKLDKLAVVFLKVFSYNLNIVGSLEWKILHVKPLMHVYLYDLIYLHCR